MSLFKTPVAKNSPLAANQESSTNGSSPVPRVGVITATVTTLDQLLEQSRRLVQSDRQQSLPQIQFGLNQLQSRAKDLSDRASTDDNARTKA